MPPRQPTALKLLKGIQRADRINPNEPQPEISAPDCPDHLPPLAKTEWDRIVPELLKLGLLTQIDRAALAGYCLSWGRHLEAEAEIVKAGCMVSVSPGGLVLTSPYLTISRQEREMMRKFMVEFGLTPASRSRVSGKTLNKGKDKKESYFD